MHGERLQIGVIGVGSWGARAHVPALLACDGVDVVAVADPDFTRAEAVAEQFGITHVFADGADLLNGIDDLDAVVIATPTDTHHDLVLAACARGVHILCEKPLAFDVAQARDLVGALDTRGLVGKLGFLFRFSPVIERMKQLIDDGYIGEIQLFEILTVNAQFIDSRVRSIGKCNCREPTAESLSSMARTASIWRSGWPALFPSSWRMVSRSYGNAPSRGRKPQW